MLFQIIFSVKLVEYLNFIFNLLRKRCVYLYLFYSEVNSIPLLIDYMHIQMPLYYLNIY